jgi:hypothetical protein
MTTLDQFLTKIVNLTEPSVDNFLSKRDAKVLRSLANIASSPDFITENQSRLLTKILQENRGKFPLFKDELEDLLKVPTWSRYFRKIDVVRTVEISTTPDGDQVILINFTYSSQIRKILGDITKKVSGLVALQNSKSYSADLTEKNIVVLVETFKSLNFVFDEKIEEYYNTIKSWTKSEVEHQFFPSNIANTNFKNKVIADIGSLELADEIIIKDRSIRYQYLVEKSPKKPENLTEKIAFRKNSKIWINKKETSLEEIFSSVIKLARLPLLVVFDGTDPNECTKQLHELGEIFEKNGIFDGVGIYFRLENAGQGQEFNKIIAEKKYNCQLDDQTKVAAIVNGKIPKFFLKTGWKPKSIVTFGKMLHNTKTTVYSNNCDLVITWSETEPLVDMRIQWE